MVLTLRSPPDCLCAVSSCRSSFSLNFTLIYTQQQQHQQHQQQAGTVVTQRYMESPRTPLCSAAAGLHNRNAHSVLICMAQSCTAYLLHAV
jgi:hypothetical protein